MLLSPKFSVLPIDRTRCGLRERAALRWRLCCIVEADFDTCLEGYPLPGKVDEFVGIYSTILNFSLCHCVRVPGGSITPKSFGDVNSSILLFSGLCS